MTDPLIWRGTSESLRAERDGRVIEVKLHTDGTWRLLIWKTEASSAIAGVFSAREVACIAAETTPLDDESLAKLARDPYPPMRFAGTS